LAQGPAVKLEAAPVQLDHIHISNGAVGIELRNVVAPSTSLSMTNITMTGVAQGFSVTNSTLASITISDASFEGASYIARMDNIEADVTFFNISGHVAVQALELENMTSVDIDGSFLSTYGVTLPLVSVAGFSNKLTVSASHLLSPFGSRYGQQAVLLLAHSHASEAVFTTFNSTFELVGTGTAPLVSLDLRNGASMNMTNVTLNHTQTGWLSSNAILPPLLSASLDCTAHQHTLSQANMTGYELLSFRFLASEATQLTSCLNISHNNFTFNSGVSAVAALRLEQSPEGAPVSVDVNYNRFLFTNRLTETVFVKLPGQSIANFSYNYWGKDTRPAWQLKSLARLLVQDGLIDANGAVAIVNPYFPTESFDQAAGMPVLDKVNRILGGVVMENLTLSSSWNVTSDVFVPVDVHVVVEPGTTIYLGDSVSMVFTSLEQLRGAPGRPIVFRGDGSRGGRVLFQRSPSAASRRRRAVQAELAHVEFHNLGSAYRAATRLELQPFQVPINEGYLAPAVTLQGAWQVSDVLFSRTTGGLGLDLMGAQASLSTSISNVHFLRVTGFGLRLLASFDNASQPRSTLSIHNVSMASVDVGMYLDCNHSVAAMVSNVNISDFSTRVASIGCQGSIADSVFSNGKARNGVRSGSGIFWSLTPQRPLAILRNTLSDGIFSYALNGQYTGSAGGAVLLEGNTVSNTVHATSIACINLRYLCRFNAAVPSLWFSKSHRQQ
jgi:hypothetical protein